MQPLMLRRQAGLWLGLIVSLLLASECFAANYQLVTGQQLSGEPLAPNPAGVIIKQADGSLTDRVAWTNFTQASLQELAKALPKSQKLIEPYIEDIEPEPVKKARQEIKFTPPPRPLEPPDPKAGLGALFRSPVTLTLLLVVYLANIYAAYEISLFRNYHPALVCGAAAVAPIIGPVIFLSLPTYIPGIEEVVPHAAEHIAYEPAVAEHAAGQDARGHPAEGHAAGHAHHAAHPPPVVYQRGSTMFNRRFFETKLSGFLRMVPGEAEKDMVISVKSSRGEYVGNRLAKVGPNELYLQVTKAGASSEVAVPYAEIQEVKIRHKDA